MPVRLFICRVLTLPVMHDTCITFVCFWMGGGSTCIPDVAFVSRRLLDCIRV